MQVQRSIVKKRPFYHEFLDEPDIPLLKFKWLPWEINPRYQRHQRQLPSGVFILQENHSPPPNFIML